MRTKSDNGVISARAISGTRVVILGLDFKGYTPPTVSSPLPEKTSKLTLKSKNEGSRQNKKSGLKVKNSSRIQFIGFFISRTDLATNETIILNPDGKPIQKFVWGDYDLLPGREYEYKISRMTHGRGFLSFSTKLVTYGSPLDLRITTEDPSKGTHGIFFNRDVAGSQAYTEKFGEYRKWHLVSKYGIPIMRNIINPRDIPSPEKSKEALEWLSRGLEEALLEFLSQATGSKFQLRAAVYEFTHKETLQALADAVERGVNVKIIRHCKGVNHPKVKRKTIVHDEHGKVVTEWIPDTTTAEATKAIQQIGFESLEFAHTWHRDTFIERRHSSALMHNKFIILLENGTPTQVWTGSTNFTDGGIYGQSNVGHIVRDADIAGRYLSYWNALSLDPPGRSSVRSYHSDNSDDESTASSNNQDPIDDIIEKQQEDLDGPLSSNSMKCIFSPRKTTKMLQFYADRMKDAKTCVHFTAAFGVSSQEIAHVLNETKMERSTDTHTGQDGLRRSPRIANRNSDVTGSRQADRTLLSQRESDNPFLRYVLFDKKPSEHSSAKARASAEKKGDDYVDYFDFRDVRENRIAYGAVLSDEENALPEDLTGLTSFADFIHLKCMLIDAITDHPTVITGSANFSAASTDRNDENMLVIHGDCAVADVYFTEFMRLFDHFHSRDNHTKPRDSPKKKTLKWGDTVEDESWLHPYFDQTNQLYQERLLLR
ncbi:hypothetical protein HJC23_000829 [Cyclotella cryptica]|uniref:Mitochondrial cardiolipin hydrolase n=1 Tax=Cyclotella cryptica TaxID=29204 RepID=A0ABD3Q7E4_9STRA|eukprot:CCRYP_008481-RA/>CCRYP_008481-RA protein AED:0.02 eAED:0.02 QI:58/1/1/1/0.75/0.6/5/2196/711